MPATPLIGEPSFAKANPNGRTKRLTDVFGGFVGLVLSGPVMLVVGLLIYRESPGPIIYRQKRTGRDGKDFTLYKLRSMRLDAESTGAGWTVANDPRRLKIGAFLREWNLDELPQFWNVLKGDMSLVGPRPERPEHIRRLKSEIPNYEARHRVKPGITGLAQVNGWRGDTDLNQRVKCDNFYIENYSWWFDIKLMFQTFINRDNAY